MKSSKDLIEKINELIDNNNFHDIQDLIKEIKFSDIDSENKKDIILKLLNSLEVEIDSMKNFVRETIDFIGKEIK